jgi:aminoglycoside phosphotransferase (APT) family kinase protein
MYDREWYSLWIDRAQQFFASADSIGSRGGTAALRWLAGRYHRVVDRLLSLPPGVIHGEFYPSNVLVTGAAGALRVWPIDWEMAAIGPGLIDLAALTSGDWRDENRRAVIGAYAAASPIYRHASLDEVIESVTYAQIHLAVQWLGWFGRRRATAAHTRDWLSDAVDRAETLRI